MFMVYGSVGIFTFGATIQPSRKAMIEESPGKAIIADALRKLQWAIS